MVDFNLEDETHFDCVFEINAVTFDYPSLANKPKINDVTLEGNKTSGELGLQPAGDYATNSRVDSVEQNIESEADTRAQDDILLQNNINTLGQEISQEASDREDADEALQEQITANTNNFANYRTSASQDVIDTNINDNIININNKIPSQASSINQLADKNFVNSSIASETANFVGTFNSLEELQAVENPTNNDYGFVKTVDSVGNTIYNRYKYNALQQAWLFEYALNNSSFTANQWAAINSGATSDNITNFNSHIANTNNPHSVTKNQVGLGNVDNTSDLNKPISNATQTALNNKYDASNPNGYQTSSQVSTMISTHNTSITAHEDIREKIKEIELFKFPNATIVGSPTIQSGQVSGFSNSNYMIFPFVVDVRNKNFEINFCFTTGSDVTTQQNILDSSYGLALAVKDGHGLMAMSSTGNSFDIGQVAGTYTIQANKTYYAKLTWDGSIYKTAISIDGTEYTDDMSIKSSLGLYPTTIYIGSASYDALGRNPNPFNGSINMNKCNLKISNLEVWQGMDDVGLATRADVSLSNLDKIGESKINKDWKYAKSIEQKYEIYNEEEGFNLLSTQKRSTFDRSKFTVVGTPTITDDGIASGFSSGKIYTSLQYENINSFKINFKGKYVKHGEEQLLLAFIKNPRVNDGTCLNINAYGYLKFVARDKDGSDITIPFFDINMKDYENSDIEIKLEYKNNNLRCIINDIEKYNDNADLSTIYLGDNVYIGRLDNNFFTWQGQIDLKQFSITVDGVEVFNGNKTGIDQIKKDDYTVVGSPVITDDFIVSEFSSGNYLEIPNTNMHTADSWGVDISLIAGSTSVDYEGILTQKAGNGFTLMGSTTIGSFKLSLSSDNSSWDICHLNILTVSANTGDKLHINVSFDGEKYMAQAYNATTKAYSNILVINSTSKIYSSPTQLGTLRTSTYTCNQQIDLKGLKIYTNNKLSYLPVLYIPYTQSKTGNKIVDATYRDRVQDMYEQFGYTHYYTMGDVPEKYNVQVVGSPTLVSWIASGLDDSNYIELISPSVWSDLSNWHLSFEKDWDSSNYTYFCKFGGDYYNYLQYHQEWNAFIFNAYDNVDGSGFGATIEGIRSKVQSGKLKFDVYYSSETGYYFTVSQGDNTYTSSTSSNTNKMRNTSKPLLKFVRGEIDLKTVKFYSDGVEILEDLYEPAILNAYTLQTVQNETIIDSGSNYEQRADLNYKEWGNCTVSTVKQLNGKYKDTDSVVVACPHGGVTKGDDGIYKFTPSQSGGYIATGKVVL